MDIQKRGAELTVVLMGINGQSINVEGWRAFGQYWEDERKLKTFLLFGQEETQWKSGDVMFSEHDWKGPILGRY